MSLMAWIFFRAKNVHPERVPAVGGFVPAVTVLDRGDTMAMYAEGGRSRTGELSTKPRRGIGRLALLSGAPVVPVAIVGSSHVRNWKCGQFPKVTVYYGE